MSVSECYNDILLLLHRLPLLVNVLSGGGDGGGGGISNSGVGSGPSR